MPISKENRVRVEFLSKMTATPRGPSSGRRLNGSFFSSAASSRTSACSSGVRSSSRRKCRVMRCSSAASSRIAGSAARKPSICASVMISGGASRMTSGAARVDQEPGIARGRLDGLGRGAVSTMPSSSPRPRTWSTSGWPSDSMPWRSDLPSTLGAADQVVGGQHPQHRQRRRGADRVAAERAAVQAGGQQVGRRTDGEARPDRQSAAEPLGQRHDVGGDAVVLVGEERSGAAHSGLHLVEHQQRAVPRGDLAGGHQVARGRDDDAALPHDRFEEHRGGVVVDRGGQRIDVAVRARG